MKLIPSDAKPFWESVLKGPTAKFEDDNDAFSVPLVDFIIEEDIEELQEIVMEGRLAMLQES